MVKKLSISTGSKTQFIDVTEKVQAVVQEAGLTEGICYVFVPHTTAGITLNETWDPSVQRDVLHVLDDHVVPRKADYRHAEGNSPAHVKASLMGSSVLVFVENGRLQFGRWQGLYLCEFDGPRTRSVWVKLQPSLDS